MNDNGKLTLSRFSSFLCTANPSFVAAPLFIYKRACVVCTDVPACPACASDEICQMTTQSCDACPQTYCQKVSSGPTSSSSSSSAQTKGSGSDTGAIVGGVVGGLAALLIGLALVWWFYIRPKRRNIHLSSASSLSSNNNKHTALADGPHAVGPDGFHENSPNQEVYDMYEKQQGYGGPETKVLYPDGGSPVSTVASTPAMHSTAGSTNNRNTTFSQFSISTSSLTRSSTVIPIAYIPGVTTRANIVDNSSLTPNMSVYDTAQNTPASTNNGSPMVVNLNRMSERTEDRSSIGTVGYRGSTALITATTMTAMQARPNLVDIGNNSPQTPQTGASMHTISPSIDNSVDETGEIQQVQYAQAVGPSSVRYSNRMAAASPAAGRAVGLGLQADFIPEEDEETPVTIHTAEDSDSSDSSDSSDDEDYEIQHLNPLPTSMAGSSGIRPPSTNSAHPASLTRPVTGAAAEMITNSSRTSQTSSFISYKSALEQPGQGAEGRPSRASNVKTHSVMSSNRGSSSNYNVAGDEYVADLPEEAAILYSSGGSRSSHSLEPLTSPFDDKFRL